MYEKKAEIDKNKTEIDKEIKITEKERMCS